MSENLRDQIQDVARAFIVREVGEDAGPMMTEQARDFTTFVWEVVGPELDRLRAEVAASRAAHLADYGALDQQIGEMQAERDDLRARLAKVEGASQALLNARGHFCHVCTGRSPSWDGHDVNPPCETKAATDLRAALASVPEPSDSEPAPDADREAGELLYTIVVTACGLGDSALEALFDRVADAAHEQAEQVTCTGGYNANVTWTKDGAS